MQTGAYSHLWVDVWEGLQETKTPVVLFFFPGALYQ